jgi:hypothetical protein
MKAFWKDFAKTVLPEQEPPQTLIIGRCFIAVIANILACGFKIF